MDTEQRNQAAHEAAITAAAAHLPGIPREDIAAALAAAQSALEEADSHDFKETIIDSDVAGWHPPADLLERLRNGFHLATRWTLTHDRNIGIRDYAVFTAAGREEGKPFKLIVVAGGGKTPFDELREIRTDLGAVLELTNGEYPLIAPSLIRMAAGHSEDCTCPGGEDNWHSDFDPECRQHATPPVTDRDVRYFLPAARAATTWEQGNHAALYARDKDATSYDGLLVNVIHAILNHVREPSCAR